MSFVCYRKFFNQDNASEFAKLLNDNNIPYELFDDTPISLDSIQIGQKLLENFIEIRIRQQDFSLVDKIIENSVKSGLDEVDKDHYLYAFSNEELFEVLSSPDEWNELDYLLAQKILTERGVEVGNDAIELLKKQRIKSLSKNEDSKLLISIGYLTALSGGAIGIVIGWILSTSRKTLPNGQKVFSFSQKDRNHGVIIFFVGILFFVIGVIAAILELNK